MSEFKWIIKTYTEEYEKIGVSYPTHEPIVTIGFKTVDASGAQVGGYLPIPKSEIPKLIDALREVK